MGASEEEVSDWAAEQVRRALAMKRTRVSASGKLLGRAHLVSEVEAALVRADLACPDDDGLGYYELARVAVETLVGFVPEGAGDLGIG